MKIQPPYLRPGDEVAIISPSWAIDEEKIRYAVDFLETWGLKVRTGKYALNRSGPFAGNDEERLYDLQAMTDDRKIKAVFCSRGGYGTLRIIEKVNFSSLKKFPKWYVGFSDITVLHLWLTEVCRIISIHGEMPFNYLSQGISKETFKSLHATLFGYFEPVSWEGLFKRPSDVKGEITGGNLSLIYSLIGTKAEPRTAGKILFIEEVGEYYYHLDRMMTSLRLSGILKGLAALVVGGLTKIEDKDKLWCKSAEDTVFDVVSDYGYPVFFNFPAGHVSDNRAFYLGKKANISVDGSRAALTFV